jgi:tyrosinase
MLLTRRVFAQGSAALAAAVVYGPSAAQEPLRVRRSIGDLIREQSPLVESYRRGVDVMMQRDVVDKTSWWFQANIHDLPDEELAKMRSHGRYWRQCPHRNYFFLSWHRTYLYFFERIVRKASGDPDFTLPYWRYTTRNRPPCRRRSRPTPTRSARRRQIRRCRGAIRWRAPSAWNSSIAAGSDCRASRPR